MDQKRAVEHYRDHEIVCLAIPETKGWHYTISVVKHKGDKSLVHTEKSSELYRSDTQALQAAATHARHLVDGLFE